jgi:hypothetical protein
MSALNHYETDEDPEEYAHRVCEWHAANEGEPLTHDEVMIVHLMMADPESRRRCRTIVNTLTAPGGEFARLREQGKYAVGRRATAERHKLPYRRIRRLPTVNRMRVITNQRNILAARQHLSAAVKEPVSRMLNSIENNTCRYFSIGRSYEMQETVREFTAAADSDGRVLQLQVQMQAKEIAYLREALLDSLNGGQRLLPPPPPPPADDTEDPE